MRWVWLSLLFCGSLFQFVPVLVAKPLHDNNLPLPTLLCLLAGLTLLLCGFLQLDGTLGRDLPLLPTGGSLLAVGFLLVLYNLGRTLWAGRPLPLPAQFVAAGLASVAVTAALGVSFTTVLGNIATAPLLVDLTAFGLPLHVIAGLRLAAPNRSARDATVQRTAPPPFVAVAFAQEPGFSLGNATRPFAPA